MEQELKHGPEVDYSDQKQQLVSGKYRPLQIQQQSGGTSVTTSLTGTTQSLFEIPAEVLNFGESHLDFDVLVAAGGANFYNFLHMLGLCEIDRITLKTRGGQILADINDFGIVHKSIMPAYTSAEEYLQSDRVKSHATVAGCGGVGRKFAKSNALTSTALAANTDNTRIVSDDGTLDTAEDNIVGFQAIRASAANTAIAYRVSFPLSDVKASLLACKQDLYFGEILTLTVTWSQSNKWGCIGDTAVTDISNPAAFTAAPAISSLYLYLGVEVDPDIASAVREKSMSGHHMTIPYLYTYKQSVTSTSRSIQNKVNSGHGKKLLRVATVTTDSAETLNDFGNMSNLLGTEKVATMNTSLNGRQLQDFTLTYANFDQFRHLKKMLAGSAYLSNGMYDVVPTWWDNFASNKSVQWEKDDFVDSGLSLMPSPSNPSGEYLYGYRATSAVANQNIYTIIICQRDLFISSQGIEVR